MTTRIVLPTYCRPEKLARLLRSMDAGMTPNTEVHIGWSPGDPTRREGDRLLVGRPWLRYFTHEPAFHAAEFWNAYLARVQADIYVYLCDDTELMRDTLVTARLLYLANFPHFDGLLGFDQINLRAAGVDTCPAAFGAIGRKFIDAFPGRRVFCPDYHTLWVDQEMMEYAQARGKFVFAPEVRLYHHHPSVNSQDLDVTHTHNRQFKRADNATRATRRSRGLTWGLSWELVNAEKGASA